MPSSTLWSRWRDFVMEARVTLIAGRYEMAIGWIVAHCPAPDKFAHSYAGLAIWLVAVLVLPVRKGSVRPLLIVLAAELGNECIDRLAHGSWQWRDTLGDMVATWFWPTMLTAASRWAGRRGRVLLP